MSLNDPISEFLTHIRNASMRQHAVVESPANNLKAEVAKVLKSEGYIREFTQVKDLRGHNRIRVELKYDEKGKSVIRGIKRISTPGVRRYVGYRDITPVMNGQGIAIISTSRGVKTDLDCRAEKSGGEVICQVW